MLVEFVSGRDDAILSVDLFVPNGSNATFDKLDVAPGKGEHILDFKLMIDDENVQDAERQWPPGKYEADLVIDGEYQETVSFKISK